MGGKKHVPGALGFQNHAVRTQNITSELLFSMYQWQSTFWKLCFFDLLLYCACLGFKKLQLQKIRNVLTFVFENIIVLLIGANCAPMVFPLKGFHVESTVSPVVDQKYVKCITRFWTSTCYFIFFPCCSQISSSVTSKLFSEFSPLNQRLAMHNMTQMEQV